MKIVFFGGSGSGTSTLARELGIKLYSTFLDADDYYWKKTDIPFEIKIPKEEGIRMLKEEFRKHENLIISGSLDTWGPFWNQAFDIGFFIQLSHKSRMERLKSREIDRYGDLLISDPYIKQKSIEFLQWASQYDDPDFEGKSVTRHQKWKEKLSCQVYELDGEKNIQDLVQEAIQIINNL